MQQEKLIYKNFIRLALIALSLSLIVVMLGAYTRLKDAGLGCPDWPGCYGQILAPSTQAKINQANIAYPDAMRVDVPKAWTEMVHRYVAGTLGIIIFVFAGYIIANYKKLEISKSALVISIILPALVFFQAALGMWTVTLKLLPSVVMSHLLGGIAIVSLLWLIFLIITQKLFSNKANINRSNICHEFGGSLKLLAPLALIGLIIQIALGGWTSANYAALSCPSFPNCATGTNLSINFNLIFEAFNLTTGWGMDNPITHMSSDARMVLHMAHRFGAIVVCGLMLALSYNLWTAQRRSFAISILALTSFQVILGINNIVLHLPLPNALMHNIIAVILLLFIIRANFIVFRANT